jgi:hypothetical protein
VLGETQEAAIGLSSSWNERERERDKACEQKFSEEAFWKWPFGIQIRWEDIFFHCVTAQESLFIF